MADNGNEQAFTQIRRRAPRKTSAVALRSTAKELSISSSTTQNRTLLTSDVCQKGFSDKNKCKCGARETVVHVLVDCLKLCDLRQQLRSRIGDALNSIAAMLGGRPYKKRNVNRICISTWFT